MKKLLSIIMSLALVLGSLLGVTACSSFGGSETDLSLLPVKMGDKWGYIDHEGKYVINPQFTTAHCFHDGLALVGLNGKYGYIDKVGKYVITPRYVDATRFSEGVAWVVSPDGPLCLIDKKGEILGVRRDLIYAYPFSEGVCIAEGYEDKYYIVDKIGNTLHTVPEGLWVRGDFHDGLARVSDRKNLNNLFNEGFINQKGELVISCQFDEVTAFHRGEATVEAENGRWGTIDKEGNYIINPQFDWIGPVDGNLYPIAVGGQYGWCDRTGKIVINPQFEDFSMFMGGDLAMANIGGKYGYVDKEGKLQINPQFDEALPFCIDDKLAWVKSGKKWGLIDKEGKFVVNPQFDEFLLEFVDVFVTRFDPAYSQNFYAGGIAAHVQKLLDGNCFDGMKITETSISQFRKKYSLSDGKTSKDVDYSRDLDYSIRAVGTFTRRVSDGWWGTQLEQLPNAKLDAVRLTLEPKEEKNVEPLRAELRKTLGGDQGKRSSGQYFEMSRVGSVITITVSDKPLD